ncbi:unnamed protein product [Diamesa serratosioi]
MINLKVKTLDSQNHDFEVDEEITVRQFKEHIAEKVSITADLQRLIYCGRVLNDEKTLKEYDVNGKCVHLVQRPPPSANNNNNNNDHSANTEPRSRPRVSTRTVNMGEIRDFENLMMGTFSIPMNGNIVGAPQTTSSLNPSSTLCMNRITVARYMLQCANNIAAYLENPENGLNNTAMDLLSQQTMESTVFEVGISAVTDSDIPQQDVQNIVQAFQGAVSAAFRQNGISNIVVQHNNDSMPGIQVFGTVPNSGSSSNNNSGATTASATISMPIHFNNLPGASNFVNPNSNGTASASTPSNPSSSTPETSTTTTEPRTTSRQQTTSTQTLGEVVHQMQNVQVRLNPFIQQYYEILLNDPAYEAVTDRESAQRVFDRVSEALHYMSHAQHAISDLMLELSTTTPRHLCCRPILVEQSAFVSSGISAVPQGRYVIPGATGAVPPSATAPPPTTAAAGTTTTTTAPVTSATTTGTTAQQGQSRLRRQVYYYGPMARIPSRLRTIQRPSGINNGNFARRFLDSFVNSSANQTNNNQTSTTNSPAQSTASGGGGSGTEAVQPATPVTMSTPLPTDVPTQDPSRQARVTSVTQPTTSTQTRSTSRPQILTSTTLPPTSIRNLRPIPTNVLSSFDSFLPCNSHHIRENAQQLNQQTQTRHLTPHRHPFQRRTVSLDRNSARLIPTAPVRLPPRLPPRDAIWRSCIGGVMDITDEEIRHRFMLFGIRFSFLDLTNISPEFFNGQQARLNTYFRGMYFSRMEMTESNIEIAIKKMLKQLERYFYRLNRFQHPDYNVRASIENLIIKSVPLFIKIICEPPSPEFGTQLQRQLIVFCENLYMVLVKCVGAAESEKLLNEAANMVINGGSTGEFNLKFIYKIPMEVDQSTNVSPMTVDGEDDIVTPEMTSEDSIQADDLLREPLPNIVSGTEPWHSQFSQNWLPVITRDIARQRRQNAQQPYSDAYISGMSSKRRKVLQIQKPPTDIQQLIADGVRNAVQTGKKPIASSSRSNQPQNSAGPAIDQVVAVISQDPAIQASYRDELRTQISQRLRNDPDYKPENYPNCSKYFNK